MDANIGGAQVTPAATPNVTPDLSGLNNIKAEGAQVKPGTEAKGVAKSSVEGSSTKPVAEMTPNQAKDALEKISLGEGETYTKAELKVLLEKARKAEEIEKGANKKFMESSNMKKEAMRLLKMAKEDPKGFLQKTGKDPKKFAYDEVAEDIKNQTRDPREVALEEAQKKLEQFEKEKAERLEKLKAEKMEKEAKALEQKFHAEAIDALESYPELPKTPAVVAQLAKAVLAVKNTHGVTLTMKEVAPMVVNQLRQQISNVIKGADAEKLISLIGQEAVDSILKYSMNKLKDPLKNGQGAVNDSGQAQPEKKRWKNSHEYWKSMDRAAKEERERGGR